MVSTSTCTITLPNRVWMMDWLPSGFTEIMLSRLNKNLEGFIRLPIREPLREFHEMSHDLSLVLAGPLDRSTNTDVAGYNLFKPALGQAVRGSSEKAFSFGESFGSVPCLSK